MMEICKVIIQTGYFDVARASSYCQHRRARWGNRVFLRGEAGTDWEFEALRFRDLICQMQTWVTQVDRLGFWVLPEPLPNVREGDLAWGEETLLWDNEGAPWPENPNDPSPALAPWVGQKARDPNTTAWPLPPSVAYRWERDIPTLGGRRFYGYLRCVERQEWRTSHPRAVSCLPFFFLPDRLGLIFDRQIAAPLEDSGASIWHQDGAPVREIVISHRRGVTSWHEVDGYLPGIVMTTARNFSLPEL